MRVAWPRPDLYVIAGFGLAVVPGHPVGFWLAGGRIVAWLARQAQHTLSLLPKHHWARRHLMPLMGALVDVARPIWMGFFAVWIAQLALRVVDASASDARIWAVESAALDAKHALTWLLDWRVTLPLLALILGGIVFRGRIGLLKIVQRLRRPITRAAVFLIALTSFSFLTVTTLAAGIPRWISQRVATEKRSALHAARRDLLAAEYLAATIPRLTINAKQVLHDTVAQASPSSAASDGADFGKRLRPPIPRGPDTASAADTGTPDAEVQARRMAEGAVEPASPSVTEELEERTSQIHQRVRAATEVIVEAIKTIVGTAVPHDLDPLVRQFVKGCIGSLAKTIPTTLAEDSGATEAAASFIKRMQGAVPLGESPSAVATHVDTEDRSGRREPELAAGPLRGAADGRGEDRCWECCHYLDGRKIGCFFVGCMPREAAQRLCL